MPAAALAVRRVCISVTDGQMSIGEFVPRIGLSEDEAVESVDEEDEALFGNHSNLYNSGNTYSPDWPRNSQRVAALWKSQYGQDVDGVIGIRPGVPAVSAGPGR